MEINKVQLIMLRLLLPLAFLTYFSSAEAEPQTIIIPLNLPSTPYYDRGFYPYQHNRLPQYHNYEQQQHQSPFTYPSSVIDRQQLSYYPVGSYPNRLTGGASNNNLQQPYIMIIPLNPMFQFWNPFAASGSQGGGGMFAASGSPQGGFFAASGSPQGGMFAASGSPQGGLFAASGSHQGGLFAASGPQGGMFAASGPQGGALASSGSFGVPLPITAPTDTRLGGQTTCVDHHHEIGNCFKQTECTSYGGRPTIYCTDFSKMCCIVPLACGQSSNVKSSYFKNANWPLEGVLPSTCGVEVVQNGENTCVRVSMKQLTLPANIGYCDDIALEVAGSSRAQYEPLCGSLTGKSYDVPFDSSNKVKIEITTNQKFRVSWNINLQQIPSCDTPWPTKGSSSSGSKPSGSKPSGGTEGSGFGIEPVPPTGEKPSKAPTVGEIFSPGTAGEPGTSVAEPENIIPDFGGAGATSFGYQCGLSGIRSQKRKPPTFRLRDKGHIPASVPGCINERGENICPNPEQANPLLQSLDWTIPVLSESNVYKFAGKPLELKTRITYGTQTQPHEYPWAIAMYSNGRFHCGATLISDRHVLTAAHCVVKQEKNPSSLNLSIGDWNINTQSDGKNIEGQLAKIVTHPGYSTVTLKNDVAVLTLSKRITLSDTVRPICLPDSEVALSGQLATVTGWGRDQNNKLQSVLMKLSANIVTNEVCDQRWIEKGAPKGIIVDSMLCMDAQYGDSCKGDSGGPAVMEYPTDSGKYIQVGIVSFGSASCTDKNLPGVYTNVGKLVDWIKTQMV